jgi:hypothetical protein
MNKFHAAACCITLLLSPRLRANEPSPGGAMDYHSLNLDQRRREIIGLMEAQDPLFKELQSRYPDHWVFVSYLANPKNSPVVNVDVLVPPCYDVTYQRYIVVSRQGSITLGKSSLIYEEVATLNANERDIQYGKQQGEINEADRRRFILGATLPLPQPTSPLSFEAIRHFWNAVVYPK